MDEKYVCKLISLKVFFFPFYNKYYFLRIGTFYMVTIISIVALFSIKLHTVFKTWPTQRIAFEFENYHGVPKKIKRSARKGNNL